MAKATGISQSATSRWKHGSYPSIDVLSVICKYLNVSADYLLELEPPEPPPNKSSPLEENEKMLVNYYRTADKRGKEYIFETAKREASRANQAKEKSLNSKIG